MSLSVNSGVPLYGTEPVSGNGDAENRLTIAVDNVSEGQANYGYDGFGQHVTKSTQGSISTVYVYDIFGASRTRQPSCSRFPHHPAPAGPMKVDERAT